MKMQNTHLEPAAELCPPLVHSQPCCVGGRPCRGLPRGLPQLLVHCHRLPRRLPPPLQLLIQLRAVLLRPSASAAAYVGAALVQHQHICRRLRFFGSWVGRFACTQNFGWGTVASNGNLRGSVRGISWRSVRR